MRQKFSRRCRSSQSPRWPPQRNWKRSGSFSGTMTLARFRKKILVSGFWVSHSLPNKGRLLDGLILIRNGFARLSRQHGDGHQTIAYLGKGQAFGLRELAHNWKTGQERPAMLSLRAVGYVDVLKIPVATVEKLILPKVPAKKLPPELPSLDSGGQRAKETRRMVQRRREHGSGIAGVFWLSNVSSMALRR